MKNRLFDLHPGKGKTAKFGRPKRFVLDHQHNWDEIFVLSYRNNQHQKTWYISSNFTDQERMLLINLIYDDSSTDAEENEPCQSMRTT